MGRIAVVTDSAACIPRELIRRYDIHIVPFRLVWERQTYRDGLDITPAEFYARFRECETRPTTAQPSIGDFAALYQRLGQEAEGIVSIHIPRELSSTWSAAEMAAEQFSPVPVRVMDSRMATMAGGFVVLAAARAAAAGGDLEQVAGAAEAVIPHTGLYATLSTLEHLRRGGRIGEAATLLGSRLSICPVLYLTEGRVKVAGVTRSRRRALKRILDLLAQQVGECPIRASVFHGDVPAVAQKLADELQARFHCIEFYITEFTPVMGAHTGPGAIGVAFCTV